MMMILARTNNYTRAIALPCIYLLLFIPLSSLGNQHSTQSHPKEIIWAAPLFPPWMSKTENGYEGILYNIVNEAASRAELNLIVKPVPIMRMYSYLNTGEADFSIIPTVDPVKRFAKNPDLFVNTNPIYHSRLAIFAIRNSPVAHTSSLEKLKNYTLGSLYLPKDIRKASSFSSYFSKEHNWVGFQSTLAIAKALKSGRIDIALVSSLSFVKEATELGIIEDIKAVKNLDVQNGTYVIWSKNSRTSPNSVVADEFFKELGQMSCDGTTKKIIRKWVNQTVLKEKMSTLMQQSVEQAITPACEHK